MVDNPPVPAAPPDPPEVSGPIEGSDEWKQVQGIKDKRREFGAGVAFPTGNKIRHPLPLIHEDQVYIGKLMHHSALQGVALEGKISHKGCGISIGWQDRISKTRTPATQRISGQDLSSVAVSQLLRMASDQAELLKKFKKNQEKQDRCARRAARKAKKAADAMMSMMRNFMKSHSTGSQKKKKSSKNKSTKSTNRNAFPAVTLFENQSGRVLCKDSEVINDKLLTAECSQNNMDNINKISKRNITEGCSMNHPAKSICNNGLFTIHQQSFRQYRLQCPAK
jgi:hypothetical protein